jgi:membrane protein
VEEASPLSPEARAQHPKVHTESEARWFAHLGPFEQSAEIIRRVVVGVYSEGFTQAGNFAYLSLVALFAFCIVAATIAGGFGQTEKGVELIDAFFQTVPPGAAEGLKGPLESAMNARTGPLLWLSALVSLWTTGSLIEAFRSVLNHAYGTAAQRYFWEYRLGSLVAIVLAVVVGMMAFSAQVLVSAIEDVVYRFVPAAQQASRYFAWGRIIPFIGVFFAIYVVFRGLTPRKYRARQFPKWPGAALVSLWWIGCTAVLPFFVSKMANYSLTYGSLAGVMISLIFFYLIGLGMVTGAQLNAALANAQENGIKTINNE